MCIRDSSCTEQAAKAPEAVKGVHDRASVLVLDEGGLGIHGDVECTVGSAEKEERQHKQGQARGEAGQDKGDTERKRHSRGDSATAEATDDDTSGGLGDEGADGRAEQGDAEGAFAQA